MIVLLPVGLVLLGVAVFDAVTTTIRVGRGAGPITGRLAAALWRFALASHRRKRVPTVLAIAGPLILITTLVTWLVLAWAGWTMIFSSGEGLVLNSTTGVAADLAERIWFAGQTIFTLGTGDFRPAPGVQIATAIAAFTGLSLVTLGISYVLPVVSAVAGRRALAVQIIALGSTPEEIVGFARTAPDAFVQYMATLVPELTLVAQQHLAYPVLHYFRAVDPRASGAVAIAKLDEALTVLVIDCDSDLPVEALQPPRRAIEFLLGTLQGVFFDRAEDAPAPPGGRETDAETEERRQLLLALVKADGYEWSDVTHSAA